MEVCILNETVPFENSVFVRWVSDRSGKSDNSGMEKIKTHL